MSKSSSPRPSTRRSPVARDDLVLEAGVVEAAVAEGHRLDRAAGDRAAEGDALELGDDLRQQALAQRRAATTAAKVAPGLGHAACAPRRPARGSRSARRRPPPGRAKRWSPGRRDEVVHAALVDVRRSVERPDLGADGVDLRVVDRARGGSRHLRQLSTKLVLRSNARSAVLSSVAFPLVPSTSELAAL